MNAILKNADKLFNEVKGDFSSLWHFKNRGETIEFVTPYSTLGGEFVSVFLTQRENGFVVSDGGRLQDIAAEQGVELETRARVHHADLLDKYSICETFGKPNDRLFHYKITKDFKMISACVYDLARFHEAVANAIYLETLFSDDETAEARFKTRVKDLLAEKMRTLSTRNNQYSIFSDDNTRHYHFSPGICEINTQRIWLPMSISRSNLSVYQRAVKDAEFGFRHIQKKISPACSFGAILAPLPEPLKNNPTAQKIGSDMEEWKEELEVESYSFDQIDSLTSMTQLFKKSA